jgi:hypothetical protein
VRVGGLKDDLPALAANVVRTLCDGPRTIWADAHGTVFSSIPDGQPSTPTTWIAGTFDFGRPMKHIEEDLRELAREHGTNSILTD